MCVGDRLLSLGRDAELMRKNGAQPPYADGASHDL